MVRAITYIIEFVEALARLAALDVIEGTVTIGGMNFRILRVPGSWAGRWDSHMQTVETAAA